MLLSEIEARHKLYAQQDFGTTTPDELDYIQSLIQKHRPRHFIEIGTASGLTSGFIAQFLQENGGETLTTLDLNTHFWAEPSEKVGYLARKIYAGDAIDIRILPQKTALDCDSLGGPWDMAFIDANHGHPWPIIDTLAVAPNLTGARIVIHHDLQLYRRYKEFRGFGPRALFNEWPDTHRHTVPANGWNIFSIDLNLAPSILEHTAIGALCNPWSVQGGLPARAAEAFRDILRKHYSASMLGEFDECRKVNRPPLPRVIALPRRLVGGALRKLRARDARCE